MHRTAHALYALFVAALILITTGCSEANTKHDTGKDSDALYLKIEQLAPDGLYVERQVCEENQVVVVGIADDIAVVSRYMRNITEAGLSPELRFIKPNGNFAVSVKDISSERVNCEKLGRYYPPAPPKDKRTQAEIQKVFKANEAKLYGIYIAALRKDPALQDKVVVMFTVLPSGKLFRLRVVSSTLNNSDFEQQFLKGLDSIDFGAKNSPAVTFIYPINFIPTATHQQDI